MEIDDVYSFGLDDMFPVQGFSQDHIMWSPYYPDDRAPSFFDNLSTEIVQLILRDVLPVIAIPASRRHIEKYKRAVNINRVLKIALVCKRWHDILMEDRSMWATMVIDATKFEDDEDQDDAESSIRNTSVNLLHKYLDMSSTRGLYLTIYGKSTSFEGNGKVFNQIIPYSERWRSIAFDMPMEGDLLDKLEACRDRMPSLQYLHLQLSTGFDTELRCTVFEHAPLLNEIHLAYVHASEILGPSLKFPWDQISRATFEGCLFPEASDLDGMFQILAKSPLEALMFKWVALLDETSLPGSVPTTAASVVTMETLRELKIIPDDSTNSSDLLDRLTCPCLTHLEVELGTQEWEPFSVIEFIRRSSCALKFVDLSGLFGSVRAHNYIIPILQQAPIASVISLELAVNEGSTTAVAAILLRDHHARFPSLRSLYFTIIESQEQPLSSERLRFQIQTLQKIIESRTRCNNEHQVSAQTSATSIPDIFLKEFVLGVNTVEDKYIWNEQHLGGLKLFCAARNVTLRIRTSGPAIVESSDSESDSSDAEDYDTDSGDSEDYETDSVELEDQETDSGDLEDHETDPNPGSEAESH